MSMMQRSKGKAGERELAGLIRELTGWDAQRRVRQHDGDSDILGVPGWAIEVKRTARDDGHIGAWWRQAVEQAGDEIPLLCYRFNRCEWRAVWPLSVSLTRQDAGMWRQWDWTVTGSLQAWAAVAREAAALDALLSSRASVELSEPVGSL